MTQYYSPATSWANLDDFTWAEHNTWYNPQGYFPIGGIMTATSPVINTGKNTWWIPTTRVSYRNTNNNNEFAITYLTSDNNQDFTEVAPGAVFGQYVKTQVTVTLKTGAEGIDKISTTLTRPTITTRVESVDTSTLPPADTATQLVATGLGVTEARTYNVGSLFSRITAVAIEPDITESRTLSVVVVDTTPTNFTFGIRDLDTWGQDSIDAVINLTITGLPLVDYDRSKAVVTPRI